MGTAAVSAQTSTDSDQTVRSINVSGVGRVKAAPDVADISLGVIIRDQEAGGASQQAAEAMEAVVTALLGMSIAEADIQTTSLSLNPVYDWESETPEVTGWEANNMVNVTIRDIESVGDVVDTATAAGANSINGISFRIEDPTEAEAEARSAAVADAQAKADQLAADAGVEINGIVAITESGGWQPEPLYVDREMAMGGEMDTMAMTPVLPGEIELSVSVIIQFEIA
jgi:uncharacterized protein YggE